MLIILDIYIYLYFETINFKTINLILKYTIKIKNIYLSFYIK